ncbi:MATE efflux family protein [Nitrobacter hamburgensis X14]|uniref:Multidrug-efflux transporter n=1 Tax=Nitrobacter hamburgensis (strain DSM 10229 / NCIMB 13809 / X14) TaxID=323097 RepID=Q1QIS0_NITHX|nr:MATE family efflux transporter [Nitrobacter hamburgensis]ABE63877.1 MATE efflux family protein [Nitrobacter hamburgensis X14]
MLFDAHRSALSREAWLGEFRATLTLGWPLVLTNLAQIALTTTDVIVLGRVGPSALAAGTLGVNLYLAILIFGIGVVTAASPMMAEAFGRKLHMVRDVRRTFRQGLWTAVLIAVPSWLLLWHTDAILILLDQEPQLAADAQVFVRALQWGMLPTLGFIALRSFFAALERPVWAMMVTAAAILFNIVANWALVFGHLGLPALGLRGSGIATTLSNTFLFVGLALVVSFGRRFRRYHLFGNWWRADWPCLVTLWRVGLPIGAALAFEITVFNAAVFLMGQFGTASIAAHAIAIQIASVSFMVPMGLAQAVTVRVGRAYGAGDRDGIARAGWASLALAIAFMTSTSVLMITAPRWLIGAFVDVNDAANVEVIGLAVSFLTCAAVFQIADGAQVVGAGMLRGLQDTRVPMIYAGLGYWGFGMSLSLLFAFRLGFQGTGIWIGLASGLAAVAILMISRWIRRERLGLVPLKDMRYREA